MLSILFGQLVYAEELKVVAVTKSGDKEDFAIFSYTPKGKNSMIVHSLATKEYAQGDISMFEIIREDGIVISAKSPSRTKRLNFKIHFLNNSPVGFEITSSAGAKQFIGASIVRPNNFDNPHEPQAEIQQQQQQPGLLGSFTGMLPMFLMMFVMMNLCRGTPGPAGGAAPAN